MTDSSVRPLGDYVRGRRERLGITLTALATLADLSKSEVSALERGKIGLPGADKRRRLAKALGVTHLDLLVAAGEITPAELGPVAGVVEVDLDDPRQLLKARIDRIRWTRDRLANVEDLLAGMERRDRVGEARA